MVISTDYTGCRAIVREEETGKVIANVTVQDCDAQLLTINVDARPFAHHNLGAHVSVLIMGDGILYEYKGTLRRAPKSYQVMIAMYRGKSVDERSAKRYKINAPGVAQRVLSVVTPHARPQPPFPVTVLDLSIGGALMHSASAMLEVGARMRLTILAAGEEEDTVLTGSVVRSQAGENGSMVYGCRFDSE